MHIFDFLMSSNCHEHLLYFSAIDIPRPWELWSSLCLFSLTSVVPLPRSWGLLSDFCKLPSSLLWLFAPISRCTLEIAKRSQLAKHMNSGAWTLKAYIGITLSLENIVFSCSTCCYDICYSGIERDLSNELKQWVLCLAESNSLWPHGL